MELISENISELSGKVSVLIVNSNEGMFPTEYETYDEAWSNLKKSINRLEKRFDKDLYLQLISMTIQAKAHYDKKEIHLGSWLLQDIRQLIRKESAFAYPEERYHWALR